MTLGFNKTDVNMEALPVVSKFLNDGNGGVKCEDVREFESPMFGKIRVAGTSEKPLFCLADVCKSLGIKNPSDCKSRLRAEGGRYYRYPYQKPIWNYRDAKDALY